MLLTTNTTGQGGSVWYSSPQLVGKGFDTTFQFKFTNGAGGPAGSGGADGIAFVVQMDDAGPGALGQAGCRIGYGGMRRSFVTEFDSFQNNYYCAEIQDPPVDHVAIKAQVDGDYYPPVDASHDPTLRYTLGEYVLGPNALKDGVVHRARIVYIPPQYRLANPPSIPGCVNNYGAPNAGVWCVYVDNMTAPVIVRQYIYELWTTIPGNLHAITDDYGMAYVGFTGATGANSEQQEVTSWDFVPFTECSTSDGTPTNTPASSATPCGATPTATPTSTWTPSQTPTPTRTPTRTKTPQPTRTLTPSFTPIACGGSSAQSGGVQPNSPLCQVTHDFYVSCHNNEIMNNDQNPPTNEGLNFRSAPDKSSSIITYIPPGTLLHATAYQDANGFRFWQVTYNGQLGWAAEGTVSTKGTITGVPYLVSPPSDCPDGYPNLAAVINPTDGIPRL